MEEQRMQELVDCIERHKLSKVLKVAISGNVIIVQNVKPNKDRILSCCKELQGIGTNFVNLLPRKEFKTSSGFVAYLEKIGIF